jgi:O-acetyl-ADP-ribose deacetylase (regulator of RNase III)
MILVNGDLLTTPINIIAHQVNCMGVMGAGLALQIKNKFEWAYQDYCEALQRNGADYMFGKSQITIGECYICSL